MIVERGVVHQLAERAVAPVDVVHDAAQVIRKCAEVLHQVRAALHHLLHRSLLLALHDAVRGNHGAYQAAGDGDVTVAEQAFRNQSRGGIGADVVLELPVETPAPA